MHIQNTCARTSESGLDPIVRGGGHGISPLLRSAKSSIPLPSRFAPALWRSRAPSRFCALGVSRTLAGGPLESPSERERDVTRPQTPSPPRPTGCSSPLLVPCAPGLAHDARARATPPAETQSEAWSARRRARGRAMRERLPCMHPHARRLAQSSRKRSPTRCGVTQRRGLPFHFGRPRRTMRSNLATQGRQRRDPCCAPLARGRTRGPPVARQTLRREGGEQKSAAIGKTSSSVRRAL